MTDRRVRRGLLLVMAAAVYRMLLLSWWFLGGVLLIVCIRALRAATKEALGEPEKAMEAPAEVPQKTAGDDLPEVSPDAFLELLYDTLGAARGVHLRTLANALTHRVGGAWEVADVRRLCEAAEVAVTPTVRAPGGKPTVGVYRVDVPPLPQPLPEGVVVPAGNPLPPAATSGTTAPTTPAPTTPAEPTRRRVGDQLIVATDDPDNPARTHVQVIDVARRKRA